MIHSVTAYFLMLWSNKFIDASIISAYSTFQPVATTILAILFLHEVGVCGRSHRRSSFPATGARF